MTKDQLLFVGAAAIVALTILGLSFFGRSPNDRTSQNTVSVLMENVTEPTLVNSSILAIDNAQNSVVRLDLSQSPFALSVVIPSITTIIPAPTPERLLRYDSGATGWQSVELTTDRTTDLARGIATPTWSPKGDRIAYVFLPEDKSRATLTIANADGSDWAGILELGHFYDRLWWSPLETYMIGLDAQQEGGPRYVKIFLSSKRTETLAQAPSDGDLKWSEDGKWALLDEPGGGVQITAIESGELRPVLQTDTVGRSAWMTSNDFITLSSNGTVLRVNANNLQATALGQLPPDFTGHQLLGVIDQQLILYGDLQVVAIPLAALP